MAEKRPECAVRGMVRPGGLCPQVIVGMKLCGAKPGTCPHQRPQTPDGVNACDLCAKGFPLKDGQHYGTQALGMIPETPCARGVRVDADALEALLREHDEAVRQWALWKQGQGPLGPLVKRADRAKEAIHALIAAGVNTPDGGRDGKA